MRSAFLLVPTTLNQGIQFNFFCFGCVFLKMTSSYRRGTELSDVDMVMFYSSNAFLREL